MPNVACARCTSTWRGRQLHRWWATCRADIDVLFDLRGIACAQGALVAARPDHYIAHMLPLDAHAALAAFFDGFMLAPAPQLSVA